eukprot:gene8649-biopygen19657
MERNGGGGHSGTPATVAERCIWQRRTTWNTHRQRRAAALQWDILNNGDPFDPGSTDRGRPRVDGSTPGRYVMVLLLTPDRPRVDHGSTPARPGAGPGLPQRPRQITIADGVRSVHKALRAQTSHQCYQNDRYSHEQ